MRCKDCLKNDVCGKRHKIEHPDENGVEYTCANFLSGEEYNELKFELEEYKKTQPIGCPKCHRGNFANDKYCSHCGADLRGKCNGR